MSSSITSVSAIHPANAMAACTDGSPPRSGVPRLVSALTAMPTTAVSTSAISVSCAGASEMRSSTRVERSATWREKTR